MIATLATWQNWCTSSKREIPNFTGIAWLFSPPPRWWNLLLRPDFDMGTSFTPCKKPLEEGWAEMQAELSELLPCARSLFFLHCPPPRALHYVYAPPVFKPLYPVGTRQVSQCKKSCMSILKSEASVFPLGISLFEMPPQLINSFHYCRQLSIVVGFRSCCQLSLVVGFRNCCQIFGQTQRSIPEFYWPLRIKLHYYRQHEEDNLTLKVVTCLVSMCGIDLDSKWQLIPGIMGGYSSKDIPLQLSQYLCNWAHACHTFCEKAAMLHIPD
jgi:hypothetical protein